MHEIWATCHEAASSVAFYFDLTWLALILVNCFDNYKLGYNDVAISYYINFTKGNVLKNLACLKFQLFLTYNQ